ncbi:MAG: hypothetical protein Q8Q23_04525 [bacterium]|nr:hypothetical protein [bacterium]
MKTEQVKNIILCILIALFFGQTILSFSVSGGVAKNQPEQVVIPHYHGNDIYVFPTTNPESLAASISDFINKNKVESEYVFEVLAITSTQGYKKSLVCFRKTPILWPKEN